MDDGQMKERAALLEAAAAAERELIESEREAERALAKSEARLEKATGEYRRAKKVMRERTEEFETARATLAAVRKRRADGPG